MPPGAHPVDPVRSVPIAEDGGEAWLLSRLAIGWLAFEVCPFEHQSDPARRGGVVIGVDRDAGVVIVVRERRARRHTELREQRIPLDRLDPERLIGPDRRTCHSTARMILGAVAGGRGDLDDDDRKWISVARQLAEVR